MVVNPTFCCKIALIFCVSCVSAQDAVTLEQAGSRTGPDFAALFEGRTIAVRGQVAASPIWAYGTYYLPLRDESDHGLILRGEHDQFASCEPGDFVDARGKIEMRAGLPLLVPDSIDRIRAGAPPLAKPLDLSNAANLRNVGLMIETHGTVSRLGDNTGGTTVQMTDRGASVVAFLPHTTTGADLSNRSDLLNRIRTGERVTVTGLLTQYAPRPPFNADFQIMLASSADLKVSGLVWGMVPWGMRPWGIGPTGMWPWLAGAGLALAGLWAFWWWLRERRIDDEHNAMRTFHALSEEIIAAHSPSEIAEKLMKVIPQISRATAAWLYIFNRRTKSLERVPTEADPEPMVVPIDSQEENELANGAAVCFEKRAQVNIPDVRRSPYLNTRTKQYSPRSAMIVPLTTQGDVLGVLEAGNANRLGYFSVEEQASIQHLANQIAAALKLQEQRAIREQLFRSEKLAATGQLISGVANELRAPLELILHLSLQLTTQLAKDPEPDAERDLRLLAAESRRASEIVSRLVSFARPEDSEARAFDVNSLLAGLVQFREAERKSLELRLQNRIAPEPAFVLGAQGQIEQVFLNLLVHAEQSAAEMSSKAISISTNVMGGRVMIEIGYAARDASDGDPFSGASGGALALDVSRSIVHSHGGEIVLSRRTGLAYFELEFPVIRAAAQPDPAGSKQPDRSMTIVVVDPDAGSARQLLGLLSRRGHRVVPASEQEAADLLKRLRFDAVFWAMRTSRPAGGSKWNEVQERARGSSTAFVLVSDGYDAGLARSIEEGGNFLLARPVQESDLDRLLRQIDARSPAPLRK